VERIPIRGAVSISNHMERVGVREDITKEGIKQGLEWVDRIAALAEAKGSLARYDAGSGIRNTVVYLGVV
jgi:hypothetical protein